MKKKTTNEFIQELNSKYPNEYDVLSEYISAKDSVKIKHKKCGYIWNPKADYMINKKVLEAPCPLCHNHIIVKGVNDMWTTNPCLASLLWDEQDGYKYAECSDIQVSWKCPDCAGYIKPKNIANVRNQGLTCEKCGVLKSFPNRIMYNLLSQLNIDFRDEVRFDWCKFIYNNKETYGIYDFYFEIENKKYIVEMDGAFHTEDNILSGRYFEEAQYRDSQKDILAASQGIELIRIPCVQLTASKIQNEILQSRLNDILNLNQLDWGKCFYSSCDNKIKKCCDLYNQSIPPTEIQDILSISFPTVLKYLELGAKANLCDYAKNKKFKQVVCIEDKIAFESENEAARYYGVSRSSIDNSCVKNGYVGKRRLHFMFLNEYIEKYKESDLIYYQVA